MNRSVEPAAAPSAAPAAAPAPNRATVVRPAIVYALLFGAQGAYLPYIGVYLASSGLSLGTVGALIALFAVVSLVAAPGWGAIADGIGDVRGPVVIAGILSGGAVLLLSAAVGPLALAAATVLLAASWAGVIPMVDSQTVRLVGHRDRFGQARAPGSGLNGDNCQSSAGRVCKLARTPNPHLRVPERDALTLKCEALVQPFGGYDSALSLT